MKAKKCKSDLAGRYQQEWINSRALVTNKEKWADEGLNNWFSGGIEDMESLVTKIWLAGYDIGWASGRVGMK